jgi:primosomal protein N' (replication factor Y)
MRDDQKQRCVRVAVVAPVRETFTYTLPPELAADGKVGHRVLVPFSNRKVTGYVLGHDEGEETCQLKEVIEVLDAEPLFHEPLVPFLIWMADYYVYPIGPLIQAILPGGMNPSAYTAATLTEAGRIALRDHASDSGQREILSWIETHPGKRLPWPRRELWALERNGWVRLEMRTARRRVGPRLRRFVRPKPGLTLDHVLAGRRTPMKARNEQDLLETVFREGLLMLGKVTETYQNGAYLTHKWVKRGVLETYEAAVLRNPAGEIMVPAHVPERLHEQQKEALRHIEARVAKGGFSCSLLHGVTGSGKTEVYFRAAEKAMALGKHVILIVPEIALSLYVEGLFRSRLGARVAGYHSGLSPGERYDQWVRMASGAVDLVVGARSALFAPLPRLGLIIVDEEHDDSYKQDSGPRYQARDAAVVRARTENIPVLLGSGTPSVQSYQNGQTGRYYLLSMPVRVENRSLPAVEVVDMKRDENMDDAGGVISPRLLDAIRKNLQSRNQAILFLNRRGFHRLFLCTACGQAIRCPNCDVALTHHLSQGRLSCHYCGYHSDVPPPFGAQDHRICPQCGQTRLKPYGFGTERLEAELKGRFPGARIGRLDADTMRRKGQAFEILKRFSEKEIDILVGTQVITKGYDFPNVTLVGVIAADLSLGFPDFGAAERTFQLVSQVAGRAGRGDQPGRVVIQTFNPDHYAIRAATSHDYEMFFKAEIGLRELLGYPPFLYLACVRIQGNKESTAATVAREFGDALRHILCRWTKRGKEIQVLGPAEAPISRLKGKHRWQILIKCKSAALRSHFLHAVDNLRRTSYRSRGVQITLDVDPQQMI